MIIALVGLAWIATIGGTSGVVSTNACSASHLTHALSFEPNTRLINGLARARVDVRGLTAAGFSASEISSGLGAVRDALALIGDDLDAATQAVQTAKASLVTAQAQVRNSNTDMTQAAAASAKSALDVAQASERALLQQLRTSLKGVVSEAKAQRLDAIWNNSSRGIDVVYLVADRSEAQWIQLRDAVNQRKAAQRAGYSVPNDAQAILATVEAESAVLAAMTNIQENLAANTAAWMSAVNPQ